MKYIFYEKSELEKELIVNVLDKWCVPFKLTTYNKWNEGFYDITVDVNPNRIEWIKEKVEERINLERLYLDDVALNKKDIRTKIKRILTCFYAGFNGEKL